MLKGVNRQIIEVNEPDSIYFEKAVFYLRPGVRKLPAEISRREIGRCMGGEAGFYRRRGRLLRAMRIFTCIAMLGLLAAIIVLIM